MNDVRPIEGYAYRLRAVCIDDAEFIINLRNCECNDNRFIHSVSFDISKQEQWLREQFEKPNDYYFIIENRFTNEPEGTIGINNICDYRGEWGRWVIRQGSLASIESVILFFKFVFEILKLNEVYCRTIEDNKSVVQFHDSLGETRVGLCQEKINIGEKEYRLVEHRTNVNVFYSNILPAAEKKIVRILNRNIRDLCGEFTFDHIGVATKSIESEYVWYAMQGYRKLGEAFVDENQGIRGQFINSEASPTIELLENIEGSSTLCKQNSVGIKMYHRGYYVKNLDFAISCFKNAKARIFSEPKKSTYYGKRICFIMLKNMDLIELIER